MNVLQWGPLLTHGNDIESRFVHHSHIAKHGDPAETARRAWAKFWDGADRMAYGLDQDGIPFAKDADGTIWKFVLMFAENEFDMNREHGIPNHRRAILFCKDCRATNCVKASQNLHPFSDNRPSASWRSQLL